MQALVLTPPFLEPFRPPISGAIIAEVARLNGCEVTAIDLSIEFYNQHGADMFESLAQQFQGYTPVDPRADDIIDEFLHKHLTPDLIAKQDWILVSVFSKLEQEFTVRLLKHIKAHAKGNIVLGGSGVKVHRWAFNNTANFGQEMRDLGLTDHWIEGEGELALPELIKGNLAYAGIDGNLPAQIDEVERLPLPNYDYYDINKYEYLTPGRREVFIYGSRGCVRNCTFCDIAHFWPTFRYRSGRSIAEEMIRNYEKHGVTDYYFADSLFNGSLKAFKEFLTVITNYPQRVNWQWSGFAIIRNKKQHPPELYDLCKAAGSSNWVVGVEHAVERIRMDMRKPITNEDCEYHFEQSERANIKNTVLLIPYWPDETPEEHLEYQHMFTKWQRYVASGAIVACNITPSLLLFNDTPMAKERLFDWQVSKDAMSIMGTNAAQNFWVNPANLGLDLPERMQRVLNLYRCALDRKWPIVNAMTRLNDLKIMAKSLSENPKLNSTLDLQAI